MTPYWPEKGSSDHRAVGIWTTREIWGYPRNMGDYVALAVIDEKKEQLVAGMLYHNHFSEEGVIEITGAASTARWLTREVLWEMFDYPFNQLKCQSVVMRVDPDNTRLGRILPSYGFSKHILPRLRGRDKDECVYILHDDVWRNNGFHKQHKDAA